MVLLGIVTMFGTLTSYRVRNILRSELPSWERLLSDAALQLKAADPKKDSLLLMCYSPNIGDISLRGNRRAHKIYRRFEAQLLRFVENGGACQVICYSTGMITRMLLGLRAYASKKQSTGRVLQEIEKGRNATVWQYDAVPPQHALILEDRVGYRFLVTDDVRKGIHDVRAIKSEDADEVQYMRGFWQKCSSDLARPVASPLGFWVQRSDAGDPIVTAQFHDQSNAHELQVQTNATASFDDAEFQGDQPQSVWKFAWPRAGTFLGVRAASAQGERAAQKYFRARIVKKQRGLYHRTEWSRPFRPFATAGTGPSDAREKSAMYLVTEEARATATAACTRAARAALSRHPLRYEFVHSYPPRATFALVPAGVNPYESETIVSSERSAASVALYFHVPFCYGKCDYCHYCTWPVSDSEVSRPQYVSLLMNEIEVVAERLKTRERSVGSIYFGGGTPSILASVEDPEGVAKNALHAILLRVAENWRVSPECEVTCECAPSSVEPIPFDALQEAGVTRISIGVQTFDNELLRFLNRRYSAEEAFRAIGRATACGFKGVNIDLLYGLPSESEDRLSPWLYSLARACEVMPEGITLYQLRVKKDTRLAAVPAQQFPDEATTIHMAATARGLLTKVGYQEVAPDFYLLEEVVQGGGTKGFSAQQEFFRYQGQKARNMAFFGFGVSAYSFFSGVVGYNTRNLREYEAHLTRRELPVEYALVLTAEDLWRRFAIVGLRYGSGISLRRCEKRYGDTAREGVSRAAKPLIDHGLMAEVAKGHGKGDVWLHLTDSGRLFADEVCTRFYSLPVLEQLEQMKRQYGAYAAEGVAEGL
jgi:oxygen-independent coproporphyrinogen-3 oxidase